MVVMPDATPDPAPSPLQPIRDRAGIVAKLGPVRPGDDLTNAAHRSAADVPRLVAAVESALKLADDWDAESDHLDGLAERGDGDEEGRPVMAGQAIAYHDAAADLREAITAALAGTQLSEDENHA